MDNGCPKCKEIARKHISTLHPPGICLDCQLEQAEADVLKAMNRVEEIKQKIAKEKIKMNNTEEKIIELLKSTDREGMDAMVSFLKDEGFFESPASTRFYGAYRGGLAKHSLRVYELLRTHAIMLKLDAVSNPGQKPLPLSPENVKIAGLLHDVCKIGAYIGDKEPYKWNKGQPKGHALLSIERIKAYIELTEIEELMIKFHMGVYGLNEFYKENDWQSGEYPLRGNDSKSKEERYGNSLANTWYHNPICKLMYFCDEIAAFEEKAELLKGESECFNRSIKH